MAKYIESLSAEPLLPAERGLFLAGGISSCPDWQNQMASLLQETTWAILNPRRAYYPVDDPEAMPAQVEWEYKRLRQASAILFWFPGSSLCPIALYELGAWSMTDKLLFVGIDPAYLRRRDVEVQTKLARPDVRIVYSLQALATQVGLHPWSYA